ncbi:exoribonuclease II [Buchnera aphidicola]|uniref:Exoribonuclease II n=1 Tax=Buchnera aphidicola (Therioaphis trifolii) TaxID=1241884 RepID=A0A4D6YM46_9GAMM|nr:exoribonuclease II [Buchnera aphidicola]QCI27180.1 exoribonuclease II [Buchnera aphidicola (Therioaphis trifolii)]
MLQKKNFLLQLKNKLVLEDQKVIGIVEKHDNRFGFLKSKFKINYFIPSKYIKKVINGDKILVKICVKKNKKFAQPLILIKSFLDIFIGTIIKIGLKIFIQPHYPFLKELIICHFDNQNFGVIKKGDWFFAKLIQHKLDNYKDFNAKLIKFISSKNDNLLPWKVILTYYNVKVFFPKFNINNLNFNKNIFRKDLTDLTFITIDNDSTKDIDDAIFVEKIDNQNIKIIIAISDPTSYINPDSDLDIIASNRLFTNYLPGFDIPMLPKILSEDMFSLHPNLKKPVLACEVIIDQYGNISKKINFFLAFIKSYAKLNYNNVSNWINGIGIWKPDNNKIINQINLLYKLCNRRILWRKKNALIFKDTLEYKFHLSDNYDIIKISVEYRNIAHKMIEEAMIIANVSAANFLSKHLGFGIYNIHLGFNTVNAKHVSLILKKYDINIHYKKIITLMGFCELYRVLNSFSNNYINYRIRRYQSLGTISTIPKPHFALGFNQYLTWTSPIRKYSDMINHRLLKNIILGYPSKKPNNNIISKIINCKRRHQTIKKNITNWLYIKFFKKNNYFNKIFIANIFDILNSGIKARLLINGANIFIPITYMYHYNKNFICDRKNGILYFKDKILYRISDVIKVIILNINTHENIIIAKPYIKL